MKKYIKIWDFVILVLSLIGFTMTFYSFGVFVYKYRLTHIFIKSIVMHIIILGVLFAVINIALKKKAVRIILKLILSIIVTFALSTYFVQDPMVFIGYYNQDMAYTEDEMIKMTETVYDNENIEAFSIQNKGAELKGWFKVADTENAPTIVVFNGNGGLADPTFDLYYGISDKCNILVVDYRGYGNSSGIPNQRNTKSDALAIIDYLQMYNEYSDNGIYLLGYSIGTEIASYAATVRDVDGLILVTPFNDLVNLYNEMTGNLFTGPIKLLVKYNFSPARNIQEVEEDTLIICSNNDGMFTVDMAKEVESNALGNTELVIFEDVEHNDYFIEPYNTETYKIINEFIFK